MDRKYRGGQRLAVLRREWEEIQKAENPHSYPEGPIPGYRTEAGNVYDAQVEQYMAWERALDQRLTKLRVQAQAFPKFLEEISAKVSKPSGPNRRGTYHKRFGASWMNWWVPKDSPGKRNLSETKSGR